MKYKIEYNYTKSIISLIDKLQNKIILKFELPSEPIISPNKENAIFISPLCWECMSDIYNIDLKTAKIFKVYKWEDLKKPKFMKWETNETLIVILGETYGTISEGGNIYRLNIKHNKLDIIKKYPLEIQISQFEFLKDTENIMVYGKKYIDNNYINHIYYKEVIQINKIK
ncbi:DUF4652 domain-containing protein [Senegalia sp. (in: firmicutes)]|uniref:DUF4652 domain-containing protein n=1 Tax=Senegalia sp. (in: firmicutes) TaxID=1924098 RepID=UPI003F9BC51A